MGAVGAQTGVQAGGAAGRQIAADVGGAHQQSLGLALHDHVADDLGVSVGGVVLQQGMLADDDLVCTVAGQLSGQALDLIAQQQTAQLHAQLVGQLAAFRDQLEVGGHQLALTLLTKYPNILEVFQDGILKLNHSYNLLSIR